MLDGFSPADVKVLPALVVPELVAHVVNDDLGGPRRLGDAGQSGRQSYRQIEDKFAKEQVTPKL